MASYQTSTAYRTFRAQNGPVEIFFRLFGDPGRTPLLIVHGLSYFSYDWIPVASRLANDRQVVAMDMRGFGDSGWSRDYSVPAFASDVIAVLDHLHWDTAVLIGHSMGARNCTWCAAQNPNRTSGLALIDWSPDTAPAGARRVAETVARIPDDFSSIEDAMRYFGVDPESERGAAKRGRFEAYLTKTSNGLAIKRDPYFRAQFQRMIETGDRPNLGVDLWQALARIRCPILVVRGSRSDMFAAETIAKVKAANDRLRLVELATGHDVAAENLEGLVQCVRSFLNAQGA